LAMKVGQAYRQRYTFREIERNRQRK